MNEANPTLLAGVTTATGRRVDVLVAGGIITAVEDAAEKVPAASVAHASHAVHGADVIDLRGYVLLAAPVEPHAHLDKALLANRTPNPTFDLAGAITAVRQAYRSMTAADIDDRATRAILTSVAHGCLTIRSHADCNADLGVRAVEGLARARHALRDIVDLQIVALASHPIVGAEGAGNRQALRAAMAAGADLVGGVPALDADPLAAVRELVAAAIDAGTGLDVHADETTDPSALSLLDLARAISTTAVPGTVTASHCVSLGMQEPARVREVARAVADAGIRVVTLPQTNLYLQGRDATTRIPRGLTAIGELRRAGVAVAGGGDNMRDPFNPMGSADPFETAMLLVVAGHLSPDDAYAAVSDEARVVLGRPPVRIQPGSPADLVAIRGESLADVLASRTQDRLVLRAGRPVARTRVALEWLVTPSTSHSRADGAEPPPC